jgi:hypothetical protein
MKQFFDADNHPLRPLTNLSLQNPSHTSRTPSMLRSKTLTNNITSKKTDIPKCHPTLGSAVECSITSKRLFHLLHSTFQHNKSSPISISLCITIHINPRYTSSHQAINPHPSFQILQTNLPHHAPPNIDTHPLHPTPGSPLSRPFSCSLIPFPTDSRHRIFGRIFRGGG